MQVIKIRDKEAIYTAVETIQKGEVVICPTDTVYGFLADASNRKAVDKIFKLKRRSRQKPLPVFIRDLKMAKEIAETNERQEKIFKKYWPGKYTFVLKRKKSIKLYGLEKNTVALRVPKYKFLNDLLKKINKPLVQTSVNISGQASLIKIDDIIKQFEKQDVLVINGGSIRKKKSSKILDLTKDKIKTLRI
mgnify:CR=1 FL=1